MEASQVSLTDMNLSGIWAPEVQQKIFRKLLHCMSRPGTVNNIKEVINGEKAYLAVLVTLIDHTISLADPYSCLHDLEKVRMEAPMSSPETAKFILAQGNEKPVFEPNIGDLENPEHGATIILIVDELGSGKVHVNLKGPGIKNKTKLKLDGVDPEWFAKRKKWAQRFPLGVDFILVDKENVTALPRTTQLSGESVWPM